VNLGVLTAILRAVDEVTPVMEKVRASTRQMGQDLKEVGTIATAALTVPLAGGLALSAKAAVDFESSFAGVKKTVGDATDAMGNLTPVGAKLQQGFRDMAKELPVNVNELNKIGESAGQLGIKSDAILGFTRVIADLGVTTNLTSDEAATSLARLANITQMPQTEFDKLGSTIVALGNNFATTEAEIVAMSLRIAGAGNQIGLTEHQIMAVAASLSSVGIEAEAGGSAISKVMIQMAAAVEKGGADLEMFSTIAGTDFKKAFQEDAATALTTFIKGLDDTERHGMSTLGALEALGIEEIRMRDALLRASGAGELMNKTLSVGAQAWKENAALAKEAGERYKTFESQLQMFWNRLRDVGITIGMSLLPAMKSLLDVLTPIIGVVGSAAEMFGKLPMPVQAIAFALVGLAAAAGPVLFIAGQLVIAFGALTSSAALPAIVTLATSAGGAIATFAGAMVAAPLATFTAGIASMGWAVGGLLLKLANLSPAIAAVTLVVASAYKVYEAYGHTKALIAEKSERAGAAELEHGRQMQMMAEAGRIAGTRITDYKEAVRIVTEHVRGKVDAQKAAVEQAKQAGAAAVAAAAQEATLTRQLAASQQAVAKLTAEQRAQLTAGIEMGLSTKELTEAMGRLFPSLKLSGDAIDLFERNMKKAKAAAEEKTKQAKQLAEAIKDLNAKTLPYHETLSKIETDLGHYQLQLQATKNEVARLSLTQRAEIIAATEMGRSHEDIARVLGVSKDAVKRFADGAKDLEKGLADLNKTTHEWTDVMGRVDTIAGPLPMIYAAVKREVAGLSVEQRHAIDSGLRLGMSAKEIAANLKVSEEAIELVKQGTDDWRDSLDDLARAMSQMAEVAGGSFGAFMSGVAQLLTGLDATAKSTKAMKDGWTNLRSEGGSTVGALAQIASGALAAGAAFWQATGQGNTFMRTLNGVAQGAQIGSMFGPWGTAIGAVAGGLVGLARGLFGVSEEVKKVRAEVDKFRVDIEGGATAMQQFEAQMSGWGDRGALTLIRVRDEFAQLGLSAQQAEVIVAQLLNTDRPEQARAAMAAINDVLNEGKRRQQVLNEAIREYGFTIDELGPKFRAQQLAEQGQRVAEQWQVLIASGIEVGTVNERMSGKINEYLAIALRTGTEVPASMRPMLESMLEMGLLTDESGTKLESLERLTFAETLTQGVDRIVAAVERLTGIIGGNLPSAAGAAARTIETEFRNRALPALQATADAVRDVIEMHSPTGLEGIIHYARLAGITLSTVLGASVRDFVRAADSVGLYVEGIDVARDSVDILGQRVGDFIDTADTGFDNLYWRMRDTFDGATISAQGNFAAMEAALDGLLEKVGKVAAAKPGTIGDLDHVAGDVKAIENQLAALRQQRTGLKGDGRDAIDAEIEALQSKLSGLKETKHSLAGYAKMPELISEAAALARIHEVARHYTGMNATNGMIASLAKSYGYSGSGQIAKDRLEGFLRDLSFKLIEGRLEGFNDGTGGIRDFGRGTPVMLHGRERVQTEDQAEAEQRALLAQGSDPELKHLIRDMPRAIGVAVQDALLLSGRRR
jgi:TP901 family phage tail tape measure protein